MNLQVEMAVGSGDDAHSGSAARKYLNGMVNTIRCPSASDTVVQKNNSLTQRLVDLAREKSRQDETTRLFVVPSFLLYHSASLSEMQQLAVRFEEDIDVSMIETYSEVDQVVSDGYGLDKRDRDELDSHCGNWSN